MSALTISNRLQSALGGATYMCILLTLLRATYCRIRHLQAGVAKRTDALTHARTYRQTDTANKGMLVGAGPRPGLTIINPKRASMTQQIRLSSQLRL